MLVYTTQNTVQAFNNVLLTASSADNRFVMDVSGMAKLTLDVDYARGAAEANSDLFFSIEHSTDGTNWYALTIDTTSTASILTAREWSIEATNKLSVILDIAYKFVRISLREANVSTNFGRVTMNATVSGL